MVGPVQAGQRIHVIGIAGSGAAGTALLLHHAGAIVDGCDADDPSPYTPPLDAAGIPHVAGHDPAHLDGVDRVLVNPVVQVIGDETEVEEEGCLSLGSVRVPVERAMRVRVEARDATGEPVALELEGMDARVVQHELDHLDGVLLLDRTDAGSRREALSRLRPRLVLT